MTASENARARRAGKAPEKCANAFGRADDREDIERTGAMDVKQARPKLDPAIDGATAWLPRKRPACPGVFMRVPRARRPVRTEARGGGAEVVGRYKSRGLATLADKKEVSKKRIY